MSSVPWRIRRRTSSTLAPSLSQRRGAVCVSECGVMPGRLSPAALRCVLMRARDPDTLARACDLGSVCFVVVGVGERAGNVGQCGGAAVGVG